MSSKRERTRRSILQAAWDRLAKPGDPARLEDIAADAGVTRQSVYLHFGSRGGLLTALVAHMDDELELTPRIAEIRANPDPVDALEQMLRLSASYEPRIHGVALALLRLAPTDPDAAAAFEDRMRQRRGGFAEVLRVIEEQGKLSPDWTARQVADVLWEASAPSSYEHLVVERGWSVKTFERWLLHLARSFLVPASGSASAR
ncbi:MAG: TetR/AcrR family transcriptional regulator [Kofleriaceae bacterium]|nr:MAG: TetR/AcrR family transcriptional regulator [Kofleriaceae bacterium]MBZ0235994.1 TetR/AcrR family transcriptional regulator [Kofleriaceae bacterium]